MTIIFFSFLLIIAVLIFDLYSNTKLFKDILISSLLALFNLLLISFILIYLLKLHSLTVNFIVVFLFFINASFIATRRYKLNFYNFISTFIAISLTATIALFTLYFAGILKLKTNSLIPISGMVTAAGMRAIVLSFSYYKSKLKDMQELILNFLALGATKKEVFKFLFRDILHNSTVVIRDMLKAAGIVHIPGVMVGLLIAGIFPLKAAIIQFSLLSSMLFMFVFAPSIVMNLTIKRELKII
ncbi:ABC transporter permease [Caminibacter sp.]